MKITKTSPLTKIPTTLNLPITQEQLTNWQRGMLIQDAMPNLTPSEREFLLTGYTSEDWNQLFPPDEDEE
jgi:hypothetical protein